MKYNKLIASYILFGLFVNQFSYLSVLAKNNESNLITNTMLLKENTFNPELYPDEISNLITESLSLLEEYEKSNDIDTLYECIFKFTKIPSATGSTNITFEKDDIFDNIYYSIRTHIYEIKDIDLQTGAIITFGENLFKAWRSNKSITIFKEKYLISELVEFNINKNIEAQLRLDYLKFLCEYLEENPDSDDTDSDDIPEIEPNPPAGDEETLIPPQNSTNNDTDGGSNNENNNGSNENNSSNNNSSDISGFFTEYVKRGNSCIKVKTYYKNGKAISFKESSVPKSQYVKCGIYDYIYSILQNYNNYTVDREYIENDQNVISEYTIHYTTNKNSKNPYYFDTNIRTSISDNSVTYNQIKDALYQLSIKAEGFSVSSNSKFLSIMDGKPVVLNKAKDKYSKSDVENLLDSFSNIGFKILKNTDKKTNTLENYLYNKEIDTIEISGEEVQLSTPFILVDNQIFGPIQELVSHLNTKTTLNNNELTISNNLGVVVLKVNSRNYTVNDEEKIFVSKPMVYNYSIYSELDVVLSALGYNLVWDADSGKLIINNN